MSATLSELQSLSAEKRYAYLVKHVCEHKKIWILTDEHGCVMLSTEDEDCVPIWPSEEAANAWATGEWQSCEPSAVDLQAWMQRWTPGLIDDEVEIAVFPNPGEDGLIVSPEEFHDELEAR